MRATGRPYVVFDTVRVRYGVIEDWPLWRPEGGESIGKRRSWLIGITDRCLHIVPEYLRR